jgi:hypothetical protein
VGLVSFLSGVSKAVTRRDCLRFLMCGGGLFLTMPLSLAKAAENTTGLSILDKYLGEELSYQIGFWLIGHCGDAKTGFLRTNVPDICRISLEGLQGRLSTGRIHSFL